MPILQALLGIAYPLLIFFALSRFEARWVGLAVLVAVALRIAVARPGAARAIVRAVWLPAAAIATIGLVTVVWNDPFGLLLTPVLVNAALLAAFGGSLVRGRPTVERFARIQVDDLSTEEIHYCRRVTVVWCAFFVGNGAIAFFLAWAGELEAWAVFTGLVSYLLVGLLFGTEYVYRHWRFRRYLGGFADPLLKRIFPPDVSRPEASERAAAASTDASAVRPEAAVAPAVPPDTRES